MDEAGLKVELGAAGLKAELGVLAEDSGGVVVLLFRRGEGVEVIGAVVAVGDFVGAVGACVGAVGAVDTSAEDAGAVGAAAVAAVGAGVRAVALWARPCKHSLKYEELEF